MERGSKVRANMTDQHGSGIRGAKLLSIAALVALELATASKAEAAYYKVYTSSIAASTINSGDNYCSLAEAVKSINDGVSVANCVDLDASQPGMITLIEAPGKSYASFHYVLGSTTLTLNKPTRIQPSEEGFRAYIDSSGSLAIKVNSTADVNLYGLIISHTGTGSGRLIWNAGTLSMSESTVRNGNVTTEPLGKGGGIYNQGTLWASDLQILNNSAKRGGGVYNDDGRIPNLGANIQGNSATMAGGGIYNNSTGNGTDGRPKGYVALSFSTIQSNTAKAGGGVFNRGDMDAVTTSIKSNTASGTGSGETCHGGLSCDGFGGGVLTLTSVNQVAAFRINTSAAISSNKASGFGGGVYNTGQLNASGISIASNEAKSGGAIYAGALTDPGSGAALSNYCEVTGATGASSIVSNKTVPTGGYSIVDSNGVFGSYCTFVTSASGNAGPKYCAPAGVRPGTSCPQ